MTRQALGWVLLGAALLVCLGLLLGATLADHALQAKSHRQARERRRLNEGWAALHATASHGQKCSRCGYPLTDHDWYFEAPPVEDPPDDD
ncbi:MAG: hypothetical protein ACRDRS_12360 [Pseudonocardiaceae bacterium]